MRRILPALLAWIVAACGCKSNSQVWEESVYDEAYARGDEVQKLINKEGEVVGYEITDPTGKRKPWRIKAK